MLRTVFPIIFSLLFIVPSAFALSAEHVLTKLEYTSQPNNNLLFMGAYQSKPVHMVRSGSIGKGAWLIFTGTPTNRVRMTIDDKLGLAEILAMDGGFRIAVARVADERVEYRFYTPERRFILGAVLFKQDGQWCQGLMTTESFQGYAGLIGVTPMRGETVSSAQTASGRLFAALRRTWASAHLIPIANADDNLIKGFFSDQATDSRHFFSDPANDMFNASLVGAAAFAGKLAAQTIAHGELGAAVTAAVPFLGYVAIGVGVGIAASRVADWLATKHLRSSVSASDLFQRLTYGTRFTRLSPLATPQAFAKPGSYATTPDAARLVHGRPSEQTRRDDRTKASRDAELFQQELKRIEACRSQQDYACTQVHLAKARGLQGGYLDLNTLDAMSASIEQDKEGNNAKPERQPQPITIFAAKPGADSQKATGSKSRRNDPALVGIFDSADAPPLRQAYVFNGSDLTVTGKHCVMTYKYSTMVIANVNYLSYTSVSDAPVGCSGPRGAEFARTYIISGNSLRIESGTERPVALTRR